MRGCLAERERDQCMLKRDKELQRVTDVDRVQAEECRQLIFQAVYRQGIRDVAVNAVQKYAPLRGGERI